MEDSLIVNPREHDKAQAEALLKEIQALMVGRGYIAKCEVGRFGFMIAKVDAGAAIVGGQIKRNARVVAVVHAIGPEGVVAELTQTSNDFGKGIPRV